MELTSSCGKKTVNKQVKGLVPLYSNEKNKIGGIWKGQERC